MEEKGCGVMRGNKYKRIYEETNNGKLECIGLIKNGETIKVVKELTPQQKAIINNKSELNTYCKKLGGYIHVCYVKNQLLFNELNLKPATVSRIIYLATFIDYNNREENVLVKHSRNNKIEYLTKKDIQSLLKLKERAYYDFMKEVKEKGLLFEANDKVYLNPNYVNKGENTYKNNEYTRVFIDITRNLYENSTSRQHKHLSYVYQLLPFLHYETNILCKNPDEEDRNKLKKLCFTDICRLLNLSDDSHAVNKLKKDLFKFYITKNDKRYYFLSHITIKHGEKQESYYVINPNVIWKGKDIKIAESILTYLMID